MKAFGVIGSSVVQTLNPMVCASNDWCQIIVPDNWSSVQWLKIEIYQERVTYISAGLQFVEVR